VIQKQAKLNMKVKVGNRIYDGNKEPVMVILTDRDKENIAGMIGTDNCLYCQYPENLLWTVGNYRNIKLWMRSGIESCSTAIDICSN
jgi:hypothetical protein